VQRLGTVLVALEGCDGVGDDGVGGEVLDRERVAVSHRAVLGREHLLKVTYIQELRVMDLLAVDSYFCHGCFLCVRHQDDMICKRWSDTVTER
jgi:hypothetical protein